MTAGCRSRRRCDPTGLFRINPSSIFRPDDAHGARRMQSRTRALYDRSFGADKTRPDATDKLQTCTEEANVVQSLSGTTSGKLWGGLTCQLPFSHNDSYQTSKMQNYSTSFFLTQLRSLSLYACMLLSHLSASFSFIATCSRADSLRYFRASNRREPSGMYRNATALQSPPPLSHAPYTLQRKPTLSSLSVERRVANCGEG